MITATSKVPIHADVSLEFGPDDRRYTARGFFDNVMEPFLQVNFVSTRVTPRYFDQIQFETLLADLPSESVLSAELRRYSLLVFRTDDRHSVLVFFDQTTKTWKVREVGRYSTVGPYCLVLTKS